MNPGDYGLTFDHFGLATRHAARTLAFLSGLGYSHGETLHDPLQRVKLTMCTHVSMPAVEVIESAGEPGPLDSVLAQQPESIYHLCFRSNNLAASLLAMKGDGHRVMTVSPPKPAILFGNEPVSFYMVRGMGLIEIIASGAAA